MKISVDGGVVKTENKGAASAVCRNSEGRYVGSFDLVTEGITYPYNFRSHGLQ
jgi:hypothetical protein